MADAVCKTCGRAAAHVAFLESDHAIEIPGCSCVGPEPTLADVVTELRAQTELIARMGLVIARALGVDPVDAERWISPEAARVASSPVRSESPVASQSSPAPRGCSGCSE